MTRERWRQIGAVFEAAVRIGPDGRGAWLDAACGADDDLRAEVCRLLDQDHRADRAGFLTPPEPTDPDTDPDRTVTRRARVGRPAGARRRGCAGRRRRGFTPRPAIAPRAARRSVAEPTEIVRARLRELPMVYILILAASDLWRRAVLADDMPTLYLVDAAIGGGLVGIIALLWSRWPISLARLKALELGMVGVLAVRIAFAEYSMMLEFSRRGDVMLAQLVLKNVVLLTSVLILTYGLYVPKSWRRAAIVVGPLALLPFATLAVLARRHPTEMAWLWKGWHYSATPRVLLFTFDGLILLILAFGSAFGARTISRLRRQVAEAREFGQYRLGRPIGAGGMGEVYLAEHLLMKRPCASS